MALCKKRNVRGLGSEADIYRRRRRDTRLLQHTAGLATGSHSTCLAYSSTRGVELGSISRDHALQRIDLYPVRGVFPLPIIVIHGCWWSEVAGGIKAFSAKALRLSYWTSCHDVLASMPGGVSGPALYEQARGLVPKLKFLLTSGYSEEVLTQAVFLKFRSRCFKNPIGWPSWRQPSERPSADLRF